MSFLSLLVHKLAIVTPVQLATDDDYGHPEPGTPTVTLVRGMVQPKAAREVQQSDQAGAEVSDHTIYLLPRQLAGAAYITDADDSGPLTGGRRFQVIGVRSLEFGTMPHLEVDCKLVGTTESLAVGS